MRRRRTALLTLILFTGLAGGAALWLRAQQRQYALNRQLIAALVKGDDKHALALVEAGADPNTRYTPTPVPSLLEVVKQWLHRSPTRTNGSPTALMMACGSWWNDDSPLFAVQERRTEAPKLVDAMLTHGATVDVKDEFGNTPLMWAVCAKRRDTVGVLLAHAANVNAEDHDGITALEDATADNSSHIARWLLEHGANPNVVGAKGLTPLMDAQLWHNPGLVTLLKHYGARK